MFDTTVTQEQILQKLQFHNPKTLQGLTTELIIAETEHLQIGGVDLCEQVHETGVDHVVVEEQLLELWA